MKRLSFDFPGPLPPHEAYKTVVIVGSSPQAPSLSDKLCDSTIVVAVNNAWRAVPRYDFLVYSDDFPDHNKPDTATIQRKGRSSPQYIPAMDAEGGLDLCGATMAFAAGYWAIHAFPRSQVSFYACDMTYTGMNTHFYGHGAPDPLRKDPSLQDLAAKSLRMFYHGLLRGCLLLNASCLEVTNLCLPRDRTGEVIRRNILPAYLDAGLGSVISMAADLSSAAIDEERGISGGVDVWQRFKQIDMHWRTLEPCLAEVERIIAVSLSIP